MTSNIQDPPNMYDAVDKTSPDADWPALGAYQALNLDEASDLCRELMEAVEHEQPDKGHVDLTDELSTHPCGLTPQMLSWLSGRIQPARTAALQELETAFGTSALSRTSVGRGTLVPAEREKIEQNRLQSYHRIHTDLRRNFNELIAKRDFYRREFEQARAEHGNRDPKITNLPVYLGGLIAVVGIETMINFDSFLKLPFIKSGLFALGLSLVIGLALGGAAHIHGTVLKQYHYWFRSFDNTKALQGAQQIALGTLLLLLSVGLVAGARTYYILPLIELAEITGEDAPNLIVLTVFMTLGNLIVYAFGAYWAYHHHDEDPKYPERKLKMDAYQRDANLVTRSINQRLKQADDEVAHRLAQLDALEKAQKDSESWGRNNKAVAAFRAVDRRVEAALHRYKTALVARLSDHKPAVQFIQPTVSRDDAAQTIEMSGGQYLGRAVKLRLI